MRIAILGATSQIAKDLVISFSKYDDHELVLFARNTLALDQWLEKVGLTGRYQSKSYEEIKNQIFFDALINFVGIGDPAMVAKMGTSIFEVTYKFDHLALDYLSCNPYCRYIFLSSGAVYGSNFKEPVDENSEAKIFLNDLQPSDWYGVAKLHAESRHRAHSELSIIDIRIFNYFSHTQNMSAQFLITDIVNAISGKTILSTSPDNLVRDYLHPADFYQLISKILKFNQFNCQIDCYSKAPIEKLTLLNALKEKFNLSFIIEYKNIFSCPTGSKLCYYSLSRKAADFNFSPEYSSLETICSEIELYLKLNH